MEFSPKINLLSVSSCGFNWPSRERERARKRARLNENDKLRLRFALRLVRCARARRAAAPEFQAPMLTGR